MTNLCFVNSYNAPTVGPTEAKRRRAHVTRANFANRRRRLVQQTRRHLPAESDSTSSTTRDSTPSSNAHTADGGPWARRVASYRTGDPFACPFDLSTDAVIYFLLNEFRPIIFPSGNGSDDSPSARVWVELYRSEPALIEASMSISTGRYPKGLDPGRSDVHAYRAMKMVNRRLQNIETGIGDGVLAAVFTLSFREEMTGSRQARLAHCTGLLHMMRLRREHSKEGIPDWLSDLILYEAIAESLISPWTSADSTPWGIPAGYEDTVRSLSKVSEAAGLLLDPIRAYHQRILTGHDARNSIQRQMDRLHQMIGPLSRWEGAFVSALARSLRIFLYLLWQPEGGIDLAGLVSDLRHVLSRPSKRLCTSITLTVWQFFIGATAAERGTDDREWFMHRLTSIMGKVDLQTWDMMRATMEQAFPAEEQVFPAFRRVYEEIVDQRPW